MAENKFNPYDLSKHQESPAEAKAPRKHISIPVRAELDKPLQHFIARCETFLEKAKNVGDTDVTLELQKILSTGRYLQTLLVASVPLRKANLPFEIGSVAPPSAVTTDAVLGTPIQLQNATERGAVLVVDDDRRTRDVLRSMLEDMGNTVSTAQNGREALELLHTAEFDLVVSDINMPELNGYQLLEVLKEDMAWRRMPVVVLSGNTETSSAARCIQMGAEDYLLKPIDAVLLQARINACLEKKRLRDMELAYLHQLQVEQDKSESLLLNILPQPIAERLKQGESVIADHFEAVTVLFADIAGFTALAASIPPAELVERLNEIFSAFDRLAEKHGLEKIKTIGDAYMCVGGLPCPLDNHAEAVAEMALDLQQEILRINTVRGTSLSMRVGIHTGPVVAGVIGKKKFNYDLWGDTVNTASRMESASHPGHIQISEAAYNLLKDKFVCAARPPVEIKGKGTMSTFLLMGKRQNEDPAPR